MAKFPPRLARKVLLSFLRDDLEEEVLGDLDEKFYSTLKTKSLARAKLNYWFQVFNYMRPFAIRKKRSIPMNQYDMLQNYFKIGVRNLLKSKFFSFINIAGMAISMTVFFLIALYIQDELRFDKDISDANLKYRIYNEHFSDDGSTRKGAMVPPMIGPTLASEYPEVESYVRFLSFNEAPLFEVGSRKFTEPRGACADPTVFDMFGLRLLEGGDSSALMKPNTVAISRTLREKYFDDRPALGESIEIFDQHFQVAAVFENFPTHSHLQLDYFLPIEGIIGADRMKSWGWNQFFTYIKLRSGTDAKAFDGKLKRFAQRYAWPETKPNGGYYIPHLMPVRDIHLHAYDQVWDIAVKGNVQTVYILTTLACFVLVVAMLNFVNLSTARAVNRAKEVGVRKVMGAFRSQLVYQFVSEAVIVSVLSLVFAVGMTEFALPYLNSFTEKHIPLSLLVHPEVLLALLLLGSITGICAGVYPAFYISRHRPTQILSHAEVTARERTFFRKGLVVFQFVLSFFLIIAAFTVSKQYKFMRSSEVGFDKDNLLVLQLRGDMTRNLEATKQSFLNHPNVLSATLGYGLPGQAYAGDGIIDKKTGKQWHINMLTVDEDYVKTLGLTLVAGRDFFPDSRWDQKHAFIISEAAVKMLGDTSVGEALQHELAWNRWDAPDSLKEGRVIGVVKDVQLNSMRDNIAPLVLHIFPFGYSSLTLRIRPTDIPATLGFLEKTWKSFNTEWPFEYKFLDDNFDRMYKAEEKLADLFVLFTGFTILVACLGLFGLVIYSTSQRHREIGIRKVLGAGEGGLVVMLAKDYLMLIGVAFAIAIPLSYVAALRWLETFAFRIQITPVLFLQAGWLITVIALITVGIQSLNASRTNPVEVLKDR
jgi:putative ABC transport system permease protein